jgi:two-component system response regulator HupR/HoxA
MVGRIAPFDLSVLVTGESGTGKEMIARAIHYESRRASKAFITENCGACPTPCSNPNCSATSAAPSPGRIEDRVGLFQQADGGTLFLDEIGETSPAFQVKLLRVLQEGEFRPLGSNRRLTVDVRIIAATNRDLEADVRSGRFREDLYYRLATIALHVPPLRERPMDLPLLARRLLDSSAPPSASRSKASPTRRSPASPPTAGRAMCANCKTKSCAWWPCPRFAACSAPTCCRRACCARRSATSMKIGPTASWPGQQGLSGGLKERMDQLEMHVLKEAMIRHRWNKSRAAREFGLSRVGLRSQAGPPRPGAG